MPEVAPPVARRFRSFGIVVIVAVIIGCWILGSPRSAGPDEPSHMIASAALVRGERTGITSPGNPGVKTFELPAMVGAPDPGCWAQQEFTPVSCAQVGPLTSATTVLGTTSAGYAPWALFLPGLASFAPTAGGYAYLARMLSALLPILLVGLALAQIRRRGAGAATATVLCLTPIAWFTFGVVNPSALAIAGGLALVVGLTGAMDRPALATAVAGWAAVLLARRDGPLWATVAVLAVCVLRQRRPGWWWSHLGRTSRLIVAACVPLAVATPYIDGDRGFNLVLAMAPVGLVVVESASRSYARLSSSSARLVACMSAAALVAIGIVVAAVSRPTGFRAETLRLIVSSTGRHLRELVGVLGWLDAPVPDSMVLLWWAAFGALAAVAYLEHRRALWVGLGTLVALILLSWLLQLGQGANDGEYWQGRYSMPLFVGVGLLLGDRAVPNRRALIDQLAPLLAGVTWLVWNVAFVATQQRWGVGVAGSWYPWKWNTWGEPIAPLGLIIAHGVATAAAMRWLLRLSPIEASGGPAAAAT